MIAAEGAGVIVPGVAGEGQDVGRGGRLCDRGGGVGNVELNRAGLRERAAGHGRTALQVGHEDAMLARLVEAALVEGAVAGYEGRDVTPEDAVVDGRVEVDAGERQPVHRGGVDLALDAV